MKFISEYNIILNDEIKSKDREALIALSKLDGYVKNSPFKTGYEFITILKEILNSNKIENIHTTYIDLLEASVNENKIKNKDTKTTFYNLSAINYGIQYIEENSFLDKKIFIEIQQIIRSVDEDIRRIPNVIRNSKNEVVYTPPQTFEQITLYLNDLEKFINDSKSDNDYGILIKMALCHFQFEAIHPFSDGNGRTGRIINILFLILKNINECPNLSLSYYIIQNRDQYYETLKECHDNDDNIINFIEYMLNGIMIACDDGMKLIKSIKEKYETCLMECKNIIKKIDEKSFLKLFNKIIFNEKDFMTAFKISRNTSVKYMEILIEKDVIVRMNNPKNLLFKVICDLLCLNE